MNEGIAEEIIEESVKAEVLEEKTTIVGAIIFGDNVF
jgi:hypothetical protein